MRRTIPLILAAAVFSSVFPRRRRPPASPVAGANSSRPIVSAGGASRGRSKTGRSTTCCESTTENSGSATESCPAGRWPTIACLTGRFRALYPWSAETPRCRTSQVSYTLEGRRRTESLVVQEGFDLASTGDADALKVANHASPGPLLQEHLFIVRKGSQALEVVVRATNRGEKPLRDVAAAVSYQQDFNWSGFGAADQSGQYEPINASGQRRAAAAFAYSSGMKRGYEIIAGDGCELACQLDPVLNRWQTSLAGRVAELKSGESVQLHYVLRVLGDVPKHVNAVDMRAEDRLERGFNSPGSIICPGSRHGRSAAALHCPRSSPGWSSPRPAA